MTFDRSALLDATEAYWNAETGTDKGLEAFLSTYLERTGLTDAHNAAVASHEDFRNRFAGIHASATASTTQN